MVALSDRDKAIMRGLLDGAMERDRPISLAVDTDDLAKVLQRQNDMIAKLVAGHEVLSRGMSMLMESFAELQKQLSKPREPISLQIVHGEKTSYVTGK